MKRRKLLTEEDILQSPGSPYSRAEATLESRYSQYVSDAYGRHKALFPCNAAVLIEILFFILFSYSSHGSTPRTAHTWLGKTGKDETSLGSPELRTTPESR